MRPVSVIIPVRHDMPALEALLPPLGRQAGLEIIVAGADDEPDLERTISRYPGTRLIRTTVGRARQMNAGAAAATGDWLLFLHADSAMPPAWKDALDRAVASPGTIGGWFQFRLDASEWQARVIERLVAVRIRLWRLPYGDQGLFVRRDVFTALGGYRELPLMEDVEFVRRLVRAGRVVEVPVPIVTSARRWRRDGWFRRSARNLALVALYAAGCAPARLARWYGKRG